ncbi:MAG TPA: helix-hairpin-helix domain-containing protein [Pyrinomonadaceae bacterium]|nr:helix-hairpin-helix domain-containing protein [Pyrinomonadaceae bacterium]
MPRSESLAGDKASQEIEHGEAATMPPVSINTAPREQLERLPGIGPALAARIVEHRERYGPFRRAEHLMMVRGISERRFRQMRSLISLE